MKKLLSLLMILCILSAGCSNKEVTVIDNDIKKETSEKETDEIQALLDSLSLEEKIGQLFIIRPDGLTTSESLKGENSKGIKELTEEMSYLYSLYPVGGFCIFDKNLKNEEQLLKLINDLKALGRVKPFIAIDEEGGTVSRIANNGAFDVEKFTDMDTIAESLDYKKAKYLGKTIGRYLKGYGFDLDFAPVCDVNTNPNNKVIGKRAFGDDPIVASAMIEKVIEGLHEEGIMTCIKHFPGHGDTSSDSHLGYTETLKTWDELLNCEMLPFIEGIKAGSEMVMVAHIATPNITGDNAPATLSYELLTNKLRNELGFEGVIITDSFAMGAITDYYKAGEAAIKAIQAGADIVLMPEDYFAAFNGVKEAVINGTISYKRLDESVYRILKLKSES